MRISIVDVHNRMSIVRTVFTSVERYSIDVGDVNSQSPMQYHSQLATGTGSTNATSQLPLKHKFSLLKQIYIPEEYTGSEDEVLRYKTTKISQFGINPKYYVEYSSSVIHFWYSSKAVHSTLFHIAMRVSATPAPSTSS